MEWPAGMVDRATVSLNVYNAFKAYLASGGGARWSDANKQLFEIITAVKIARGDYGN